MGRAEWPESLLRFRPLPRTALPRRDRDQKRIERGPAPSYPSLSAIPPLALRNSNAQRGLRKPLCRAAGPCPGSEASRLYRIIALSLNRARGRRYFRFFSCKTQRARRPRAASLSCWAPVLPRPVPAGRRCRGTAGRDRVHPDSRKPPHSGGDHSRPHVHPPRRCLRPGGPGARL